MRLAAALLAIASLRDCQTVPAPAMIPVEKPRPVGIEWRSLAACRGPVAREPETTLFIRLRAGFASFSVMYAPFYAGSVGVDFGGERPRWAWYMAGDFELARDQFGLLSTRADLGIRVVGKPTSWLALGGGAGGGWFCIERATAAPHLCALAFTPQVTAAMNLPRATSSTPFLYLDAGLDIQLVGDRPLGYLARAGLGWHF